MRDSGGGPSRGTTFGRIHVAGMREAHLAPKPVGQEPMIEADLVGDVDDGETVVVGCSNQDVA